MSRRQSILVVENDPDFLSSLKLLLEREGYQVHTALGPSEVNRILDSTIIHLVVADMRIIDDTDAKDMGGLRLASEIDPVIPKIVLTRFSTVESIREALRPQLHGFPLAVDFVAKQDGPHALLAAAERAFQQHVRINSSLQIDFVEDLAADKLVQAALEDWKAEKPTISDVLLADELDDLLRKLFFDASRILITRPTPFLEGTLLVKVLRILPEGSSGDVIVRVGERSRIRQEVEAHTRFSSKTSDLLIEAYSETQRLGAIIYVPVGVALEESHRLFWYVTQIEWNNATNAVLARDANSFEQSVATMLDYVSERLGSGLRSSLRQIGDFWISTLDTSAIFPEVQLPDSLPLIFYQGFTIGPYHLDHIRDILERFVHPSMRVALLFLFCEARYIEQARYLLQERLRRPFAYDVIVVGRDELQTLVADETPSGVLRLLVLSQIDLLSVSPFQVVGETPDHIFFGREMELREIAEHVRNASYAIIGGRRIGKSSLLGRLHRVRLPDAGFQTIYHDCATTPTYDAFLAVPIRDWQPKRPPDAPPTFSDLLRSPLYDKSLVLLLDEADKLVSADRANGWPLFNTLRALANSGRAQIVLSGERTLRDALRDPTSPLFNFANEILLGPLDFHAVEELVTRPMKQLEIELVDEKIIVDRTWAFTSGHPNVVQRLCRRLIERLNEQGIRRITLDDVNAVIEDPQFQEVDFLQTYWEAATSLEKVITLVLSQEARTYRLKEVRQLLAKQARIQSSATATKDALDRLVDLRSILKRSQAGYAFAVEAFPMVLANTTTVEDLLEVLIEQYEQTEAQS